MKGIKLIETAFRDAHQSLLATRMRTEDMLPIAEQMDDIGYFSLEAWGGATFDTCIRYLNEDPWERLRSLKEYVNKTPIQMLLRGQNLVGYKHYPDDIVKKFVEKSYSNGVDVFRIFDALNDLRNMKYSIKVAKDQGAHVQGVISYTISPYHTIDKFVEIAKEWQNVDSPVRRVEASLLIANKDKLYLVMGDGNVVEPTEDFISIGSGSVFALGAAKALLENTDLPAKEIVKKSLLIASQYCIYTNDHLNIEEVE